MKTRKSLSKIPKMIQRKLNHTYLNGVYLAINAIPDVYLLLDAPACGYNKLYFIHKTHDLFSDLVRRDSMHRICCTEVKTDDIIHDRDENIVKKILKISEVNDCSAVLVCSMPMANITGVQYDMIIHKARERAKVPVIEIPSKSLQEDWLGGYEETLLAIAKNIPLRKVAKKDSDVAIVGYLFDRNEGDHAGNIRELKRALDALSLNLVSVWLSGCPFNELRNIEKARTIISLPYARKTARQIAKRINSGIIELDIPFGISNTKNWINAIAGKFNKKKEAQDFIESELEEVIPINNLIVPEYILGKRFALYADPYLTSSLASALTDVGGKVDHAVIFGTNSVPADAACLKAAVSKVIYQPAYMDAFDLDNSKTDIFIGNSISASLLRIKKNKKPFIELGFPSFEYHCLAVSPYWGFKGYVNFLNRIVNKKEEGHE